MYKWKELFYPQTFVSSFYICTSNVIKRANKIYCNAFCYYWRSIIISFHSTSNLIPIKSYFLQIVQKFVSCCNKHQMAFNHSLYYLFYQYLITLGFYSSFFHHTSYPLYDFKSFSFILFSTLKVFIVSCFFSKNALACTPFT